MAKKCQVCGKKTSFGNQRSHANKASRRRFFPNLKKVNALIDGVKRKILVCTACIKAGKVQKAA
ncbi:MAG: 50S ribosomal protein L28 [candidate division Zixibacteria bacterium RBG-1]|nr:MAG: 50S ribosomal protein L28 [candidate division Zixibacteria bacterium RBG-1]OGC84791.1 MAG: 50S ribosomal protein L28 [candidate division Zixibacteria bacterium RBG_19FT_COMBO_42_43]